RQVAMHVDPIEKKPLYHFLPGSLSFSIATLGCNFRCGFCQNWEISQKSFVGVVKPEGEETLPREIIEAAIENKCQSISYTYTEPTIFFEYALETAKLASAKKLRNIFVTNGYMTSEMLVMAKEYLDAANVDLKFFKDSSYKKICSGTLQPVLDSIRLMKKIGIWVEITTLVITGENDSADELRGIAEFIASVDKDMPWHISCFHPDYKFIDHQVTPEETLKNAQEIGYNAGLKYIYIGNVYGWGNDTYCHNCKKPLIKREGFGILGYNIKEGRCPFCNINIPGVFI
ncbi:MAG: AmmeMemoRadiSam system radical SAM enzyme, partial [Candidatus Omnitrophica bacterium]|nr:AmmeMemoRadiSam system radical SAM enzyme [Candidatus Omnitrophota bacterium]